MNDKGFTLVEIMVSVLIIAILAAGMLASFIGSHQFFNRSRHRLQALHFITETYDRLRADYSYTDAEMSVAGSPHQEAEIGVIVRGDLVNLNHDLTYDIAEQAGAYKEISFSLTWDETVF